MSTISALGIGSGLDLNGLLDQLETAEREKLVPIVEQKNSYQSKISAFGQLRSSLASFQAAAEKLNNSSLFGGVKSSVSGDALTAAATSGAQPGSYQVNVSQLARAYSVATAGVADRDADLGAGTVSISLANGDSLSVELGAEDSSLEALRDAINEQDAGVRASIVNDGGDSPYRLVLTSATEGEDAAISSVDFGDLSASLALDPVTEVTARNAEFSVNGVDVTSQTNQVEGALEDITLVLAEEGEATVTINPNTKAIEDAITGFVSAYNKLQNSIGDLTRFDADSGVAGQLLGDNTLRSVSTRLRSVFVEGVEEGALQRLTDVGITLQLDGTLEIDEEALGELVETGLSDLQDFFAGDSSTSGLAGKLGGTLDDMLESSGLLETATGGLESRIDSLDDRYDRVELSIERTMNRYRMQFAQLDSLVANMNSTSSYIAQQFDILNAQLNQ
ncbi:flagellar hook protein [Mangrovimicrobium sediminis]|uniref:Flagellar hook-associated protein 2 n=1 Tax=Mangrovimicrobium sediminis TaxID=2562682 RepID=A0A4Z0M155_9GAMM|nr:flagellar filament capping protein FliD [Haliea sp. SAOS-164]TGD73157.1 flagellar hook protein [Haliea sp. SAOS-164]